MNINQIIKDAGVDADWVQFEDEYQRAVFMNMSCGGTGETALYTTESVTKIVQQALRECLHPDVIRYTHELVLTMLEELGEKNDV